jgi:tRNA U34 5-methylaminomethyl-2-thiouridine-forming methyltransferase MnmC
VIENAKDAHVDPDMHVLPDPQDTLYTAITEDGSLSLVSGEYTELYHNRAGAYSEALLSYSRVAFSVWRFIHGQNLPGCLRILDCCFGLGYNSFVLAQEAPAGLSLDITAIEIDQRVLDLLPRIVSQACFKQLTAEGLGPAQAAELARCREVSLLRGERSSILHFKMVRSCLRAYLRSTPDAPSASLDLILHDPFSPKKMTELWTIDLFAEYKRRLKEGGLILTYSSAPAVRGALQDLGFCVYRTPAQGGKSCGTLAVLGDCLEGPVHNGELGDLVMLLADDEVKRLGKSSRVPYRDPGLTLDRCEIIATRLVEQKAFAQNRA